MADRLTSSSVSGPGHQAHHPKRRSGQFRGALLAYLPVLGVMLFGALFGVLSSASSWGGTGYFPPALVTFLAGQYLVHREGIHAFWGEARGSVKGLGALVSNYKDLAPMLQQGPGHEAPLPVAPGAGGGAGPAGVGAGISDAMAAWNHAKTAYAAGKKALAQFAVFLVVFCLVQVQQQAGQGPGAVQPLAGEL